MCNVRFNEAVKTVPFKLCNKARKNSTYIHLIYVLKIAPPPCSPKKMKNIPLAFAEPYVR